MPRRSPTHRTAAGAALALAVALAGCAASPEPAPTPTKTAAAPIFGSDEEAFAAAEEAYGHFRRALTAATSKGSVEGVDFSDVAVGEGLEQANEALASYEEAGNHTSGDVTFDVRQHVQYFEDPRRGAVVQVNICEDISQLDVLDADGKSVVREGRTEIVPYEVILEGMSPDELKVSDRWARGTFCS